MNVEPKRRRSLCDGKIGNRSLSCSFAIEYQISSHFTLKIEGNDDVHVTLYWTGCHRYFNTQPKLHRTSATNMIGHLAAKRKAGGLSQCSDLKLLNSSPHN
jgi:hypothetical protein